MSHVRERGREREKERERVCDTLNPTHGPAPAPPWIKATTPVLPTPVLMSVMPYDVRSWSGWRTEN